MSEKHRCEKQIRILEFNSSRLVQCTRTGNHLEDGHYYRKTHLPSNEKDRREINRKKWNEKHNAERAERAENMRIHHNGMLCDEIAGYIDTHKEDSLIDWINGFRSIMADYKPKEKKDGSK